jgi:hypothetical protein
MSGRWLEPQATVTENRHVNRRDDESEEARIWKQLSEAGLIDVSPDEFPERIKQAKDVVMGRLSELLKIKNHVQERESAAYSLATLKKLETTLGRREKT